MGVDRRDFLKIAGVAALFGLGGKAAMDILAPGELEAATEGVPLTEGKRWSMVIDMRKCLEKQEKGACKECILACHTVHNVPDWGEPKHEIKWIWKELYEHSFPDTPNEFVDEGLRGQTVYSPVQPLPQSALRSGLSHKGHIQEGEWDCRHGYASLYRMPFLHGGLSVRFPKF